MFVGKSIIWTVGTTFFGLLQLLLLLGDSYFNGSDLDIESKVFLSGSLLFFCSAVVAAIAADHHLGSDDLHKAISFVVYWVVPVFIIICSVYLFSRVIDDGKTLHIERFKDFQIVLIGCTIAYALITKMIMFYKEGKNV